MIGFKVVPEGGDEYEVTATSRDVYLFEKLNKGKTFQSLVNNLEMGDMYRLAHLASKRQQLFTGTLEEFTDSCDLEVNSDDEEPGPTPPEVSTGR